MNPDIQVLFVFFAIFTFLFYWIFGGVFFAMLTILRLGRIHKARFSCLFTVTSIGCAVGAVFTARQWAGEAVALCVKQSQTAAQIFFASTACGFFSFLAAFLVWIGVLVILGLIFMSLSKTNEQTWFDHFVNHVQKDGEEDHQDDILLP